ncbi:MAG: ECF transporter S component [Clostridiales bacterium]|nr:ECF transporter S component [Clostridiales bacterium]
MKEASGQTSCFLHGTFFIWRMILMQKKNQLYRMVITSVLLALGLVLPFLTGQLQSFGQLLSPLHIPVLICGLTCGWGWGGALGLILPVLRMMLFSRPGAVSAYPMMFELCAYGVLTGLLYPWLRRRLSRLGASRLVAMLASLAIAMVCGRMVGGIATSLLLATGIISREPLTFGVFISDYFIATTPGAVVHLIVVPAVVLALEKAHLSPNA